MPLSFRSVRRPLSSRTGKRIVAAALFLLAFAGFPGGRAAAQESVPASAPPPAKDGARFDAEFLPMPPWAEVMTVNPVDSPGPNQPRPSFDPASGALPLGVPGSGPSAGLQIHLRNGMLAYYPAADIAAVASAGGARIAFQRAYRGERGWNSGASPGLSLGWVHNFDVRVIPSGAANAWGDMKVLYPISDIDGLRPVLNDQKRPTGEFLASNHAPFTAKGIAGETPGMWKSITLTWKSGTIWEFRPFDDKTYALYRMNDLLVTFGKRRELLTVTVQKTGEAVLIYQYDDSGLLKYVTDNAGRRVEYAFAPVSASDTKLFLQYVSTVYSAKEKPQIRYQYGYVFEIKSWLLGAVGVPGEPGKPLNFAKLAYEMGRVVKATDANGNSHRYEYYLSKVKVGVFGADDKIVSMYIQNFDKKGRNTGVTDAAGNTEEIRYSDSPTP